MWWDYGLQFLGGLEQQGFGLELQGLGDGPGVAAAGGECGEEFGGSGLGVLRAGLVQSGAERGEGLGRISLQQPQPGEFELQIDVVEAKAAAPSDLQAVVDGGAGGRQRRRAVGVSRRVCRVVREVRNQGLNSPARQCSCLASSMRACTRADQQRTCLASRASAQSRAG